MSLLRSVLRPQLIVLAAGIAVVLATHGSGTAGPNGGGVDDDGVPDAHDNCTYVPNTNQGDSDLDGYGNACDADFNDSGVVDGADFNQFKLEFGTSGETDLNCSGISDGADFNAFKLMFNSPPGPSGLACAGSPPCPVTAHGCP